MEVKSSFSEEQTDTSTKEMKAEASFEAKVGWGPFSVTVKGSASYDNKDSSTHNTHYQKSNSAKYTVNVHAGQLPVPKGVNTIIEAFTKSIQPITLSKN
jgi:VCBS repeat-containing protein